MFFRIVICVLILTANAVTGAENSAQREEIAALYKQALARNKAAVEQCIEKLEAALKKDPSNQLARVYLGSSYTLRSRDLGFGPSKLSELKRGLAAMDAAVAAAPDDPHVRLVRALTSDSLPFFLGRKTSTLEDFAILIASVSKAPGNLEPGDLQVLYFSAGKAEERSGNRERARQLWKEGTRYPVDSRLAEKLMAALADAK